MMFFRLLIIALIFAIGQVKALHLTGLKATSEWTKIKSKPPATEWKPTQPEDQCLDWLPSKDCETRATDGGCTKNKTLMLSNCCKTCMKHNATAKLAPSEVPPTTKQAKTGKMVISTIRPTKVWKRTQPHNQCVDWLTGKDCERRAKDGGCVKNKTFMSTNCCKTCTKHNTTQKPRECVDWLSGIECERRATEGGCVKNKTFMITNCCKTCMKHNVTVKPVTSQTPATTEPRKTSRSPTVWKSSKPHSVCLDWLEASTCATLAKAGGCVKNQTLMDKNCCKTCMKYNNPTTTKPVTSKDPTTTWDPSVLADIVGAWGNKKAYMTFRMEENGQNLDGTFCSLEPAASFSLRGSISMGIPASIGFTVTFQGNGQQTSTTSWSGQYRLVENKGVLYTTWIQTTPWAATRTGKDVFNKLEGDIPCLAIVAP